MAQLVTRRAVLVALGAVAAGSVLGVGYVFRNIFDSPAPESRLTGGPGGGMMGMDPADMRTYMEMFHRHNEITRTVEEIPGGVRTVTESDSADLTAQLQAHVSRMYSRVGEGAEVMCMSSSLPTLFRNADGYRRRLTLTPTGVAAEETADDPAIVQAIRDHAREVTGFVRDGMPAMMGPMMGRGGMMHGGHGGMMGPR
ncbi:hypothetical protein [Mycolicibacterium monacense]|uniref:hypothetical protein n=1 Tax=Mycolicibacterium monacense TaxID=85693 RepID=UPI0007EA3450|nr:hypothetical protein [Mycolicibacterium monacense]OBF56027.1 hypothetical protein A5778_07325 [Mycolicibacterium monacense]